jgi:hypothetical protein
MLTTRGKIAIAAVLSRNVRMSARAMVGTESYNVLVRRYSIEWNLDLKEGIDCSRWAKENSPIACGSFTPMDERAMKLANVCANKAFSNGFLKAVGTDRKGYALRYQSTLAREL